MRAFPGGFRISNSKPHDRAEAVRPMVERAAFALPGGRVVGSAREVAPSPVPDPRSEP